MSRRSQDAFVLQAAMMAFVWIATWSTAWTVKGAVVSALVIACRLLIGRFQRTWRVQRTAKLLTSLLFGVAAAPAIGFAVGSFAGPADAVLTAVGGGAIVVTIVAGLQPEDVP